MKSDGTGDGKIHTQGKKRRKKMMKMMAWDCWHLLQGCPYRLVHNLQQIGKSVRDTFPPLFGQKETTIFFICESITFIEGGGEIQDLNTALNLSPIPPQRIPFSSNCPQISNKSSSYLLMKYTRFL